MFTGMQNQQPGILSELGIDTSTYLSPMDLYDQIFWGKFHMFPSVYSYFYGILTAFRKPRAVEYGLRLDEL